MGVYSAEEIRTWVKYAAAALVAFLGGAMTYVIPLLMDPTEPAISWRMAAGFGISAVLGAGLGSRLPRPGMAPVSVQVNALKDVGVAPHQMVVVPTKAADISRMDAVDANPKILEAKLPPAA